MIGGQNVLAWHVPWTQPLDCLESSSFAAFTLRHHKGDKMMGAEHKWAICHFVSHLLWKSFLKGYTLKTDGADVAVFLETFGVK
jgi:hypothetical protein